MSLEVLISGGRGELAGAMQKEFLALGDCVHAPGRQEMDVRDEASVDACFARLNRLDVLVANAGAFGPQRQSTLEMDFEGALDLFSINALGPLRLAQALLPRLHGSLNPRIVLISSELGSMANVNPSTAIYSATKAALNKLSQCLASELKPQGICVVAMHPGWVRTDMGGPNAPLSVTESVEGMLATIDGLGIDDSGSFLNFRGEALAW